jgi:chromosome condensin MukBEF complex kleisin-like MukF subunit
MNVRLIQVVAVVMLASVFLQASSVAQANAWSYSMSASGSRRIYRFTFSKSEVDSMKKSYLSALSLATQIERYIVAREFSCLAIGLQAAIVAAAAPITANALRNTAKNSSGSMTYTQVVNRSGIPAICATGKIEEFWRSLMS